MLPDRGYLDTGLFLDHRLTRARIRGLAGGKRFLNLFAYTGTATVYAAAGGAASTRTVDLSNTYLDWARRNLELNGFGGPRHRLERADCLAWLRQPFEERYDLAFVDPPTFSNSKSMDREFDVQRDHVDLLRRVLDRLAPGGVLVFSTNHRRFRLDAEALVGAPAAAAAGLRPAAGSVSEYARLLRPPPGGLRLECGRGAGVGPRQATTRKADGRDA